MNPTASLYNNRMQLHAALEIACMDVAGKKLGIRACDLLGGALRERVPFASYLFYRYRDKPRQRAARRTPDEIVAHAQRPEAALRLHDPQAEGRASSRQTTTSRCYRARWPTPFPTTASGSIRTALVASRQAIRVGQAIEDLQQRLFRGPDLGPEGMRRLRSSSASRPATNTVVVNFEQLAANHPRRRRST